MKKLIVIFLIVVGSYLQLFAQENTMDKFYHEIKLSVNNPTSIERINELVLINIDRLKSKNNNFNKDAFIIYENEKEIPSQLYNNGFDCSHIIWLSIFSQKNLNSIFDKIFRKW